MTDKKRTVHEHNLEVENITRGIKLSSLLLGTLSKEMSHLPSGFTVENVLEQAALMLKDFANDFEAKKKKRPSDEPIH